MVLQDFYTVVSQKQINESTYDIVISVDAKHQIFEGHFPGNPVMPGVCMIQIIKDLTESISKQSLMIQTLTNVKFMALINPEINPELRLQLEIKETDEGTIKIKNTTWFNETVALKLSTVYKKINI